MYYISENNKFLIAEKREALQDYSTNIKFVNCTQEEFKEGKYIKSGDEIILNPNYEAQKAQEEHERIQELFMTRSDFFDATIKAFGADEDDLLIALSGTITPMSLDNTEQKIALNNYKNALNFYRKHPLFTILSNVPIKITEELTITITPEQWDKFFDETDKKNPDAYKELLPKEEAQQSKE